MPHAVSEIRIRQATVTDAHPLLRYIGDLQAERLDVVSNDLDLTLETEREWIEASNKTGVVLVAEQDGEIAGLLDIRRSNRPSHAHVGSFGMSVSKPWRRRGIGCRLLRAAIDESKKWPGFCRLELEVVPWNTSAIAPYEKLGFKLEARKIKAINFRGRPEDMLLMALTW